MTAPFTTRVPKIFRKTITFDGGAGSGAVGRVLVGTITGAVLITHLAARVTTDLAGATATVELGDATNTAALIAQATATNLDAGEFWQSAAPATIADAVINKLVDANIIVTVATAAVSAGVVEFTAFWLPVSSDGLIA